MVIVKVTRSVTRFSHLWITSGKSSEVVIPETHVAVDEQVVPFKGASSLKRYLPKKPKKWGYKLWALAGVSRYVYTFEVDGENGKSGPPDGWDAP